MTRRSRRRHRAERRERALGGARTPTPVAPAHPSTPVPVRRDISWTGLIGGATGLLGMGQSAVYTGLGLGDESRWWAIPLITIAAVYIPAIWVSARPSPNRRQVLRNVLAVSLLLMVAGAVLFSVSIFALLLIPSSLLAIGAGLLFERPKPTD